MSTVNGSGVSVQPSLSKLALRVCIAAPLSLCCLSTAALAQSESSSSDPTGANQLAGQQAALEEVIVTAEKRSSNLRRTPISVTAFNSDALESEQVHSLPDLKMLVPAMQMGETDGYAQITIRGIGISNFTSGQESAVAFNMNEVYVSRPTAQLGGLFDVARVTENMAGRSFWDMQPVVLQCDSAAIRVRRARDKMLREELEDSMASQRADTV